MDTDEGPSGLARGTVGVACPRKKVELHVHLDGSVRPTTAWELAQQKKIHIEGINSFLQFEKECTISEPTNLYGFIQIFAIFWPPFLGDLDALERIAYEFCEDEANAGVIYAEVRWSPRLAVGDKALHEHGPSILDEAIKRVAAGLQRGEKDFAIKTRQILCATWTDKFNNCQETLKLCQANFDKGVVGIDLLTPQPENGFVDEVQYVEPIISVWREATQTGVFRTAHAAEMGTASAVERAFFKLGCNRIGHGYHVLQDSKIYEKCIKDQLHFECCPYSSMMTGSANEWGPNHPIARFAKVGLNFSVNSDDTTVTGHTVNRDYELLLTFGVPSDKLVECNINAAMASFLPDQEKKELIAKLQK